MFSLKVKHFFEKFVKKVSRKFLLIDLERKRAGVFSLFREKEQNFF